MQFIIKFDAKIVSLIESTRNPFLTKFFAIITHLGEWKIVLVALVFISLFFIIKKKFRYDISLWMITGGGIATAFILKEVFNRNRPAGALIAETSSSFPSAHAVISVVFYGFILYLLWPNIKNKKVRALKVFVVSILVLLIGFSRIYLGVHYLSDVLAGYFIGIFWFFIGVYGIKFINRKRVSP